MRLPDFIDHLRKLDIQLRVEGDRLIINAPKGSLTPEYRETLAANKQEIIKFYQDKDIAQIRGKENLFHGKIQPSHRNGKFPLSFSQERLWFLEQLAPGSSAYSIPFAFRLDGQFNYSAFNTSVNDLIRRHATLRTTIDLDENGRPIQIVHSHDGLEIPQINLMHLPKDEREKTAVTMLHTEANIPFDLFTGPLVRVKILRLDTEEHICSFNFHHIISDGWSSGILLNELVAFYNAHVLHQSLTLPELDIQYGDFAAWQREHYVPKRFENESNYWKQKLEGPLPIVDLPTDFPRPAMQTQNGATIRLTLPESLVNNLKKLCSQRKVTLFMLLYAVFDVLLYRYTGQEDLIVGVPVANRILPEIENLIGFFINTLAIRNSIDGKMDFPTFLSRVHDSALEAFVHQEMPFEKVVELVQTERDSSRSPIFQVFFTLQNLPIRLSKFHNLQERFLHLYPTASRFDLSLNIWELDNELSCDFEFNTDLFMQTTIERLAHHYQALLESACSGDFQTIDQMAMLTASERQQLLFDWNTTDVDIPSRLSFPYLFEEQARKTPHRTAVIFEGEKISYQELNERADQLAYLLQKEGVGPGVLVGISLERSIEMVVGLLGIQKAGGAYLPLDPKFPTDRLNYMLSDSGASLLLSQTSIMDRFATSQVRIINLDEERQEAGSENRVALPEVTSERLAYVLYTSGSTGLPKGVMISQRALVNFIVAMQSQPGLNIDDRLLAVTTLSFDIAGLELYLPLVTGACIVLASSAEAADGARLVQALEDYQITVMQATPATWRMMIASGWQGNPGLKILCGGEALTQDLAGALLDRCEALWNMFGPTETTIWSSVCRIREKGQPITIGRPIANTQFYIVDKNLNPVPVGVSGELIIGGEGVASGYLNRPELTAQKFIPDPFRGKGMIYRTGDQARYLPDGQVLFLGRLDNQVKIRGFRIELGEIEAILVQHPAIEQAVVIAREDTPGDKRLVAYLIVKKKLIPSASELQQYLREKLPEYMVPSAFSILDQFPLTPNNKVDRKRLPAPEGSRLKQSHQYVAPCDEIEQLLAGIWQDALHVDRVSTQDNFFDLGGHSLLIVQVHGKINQSIKTNLTIAQMFQYPTIRDLAQFIARSKNSAEDDGLRNTITERAVRQREIINRQRRNPPVS